VGVRCTADTQVSTITTAPTGPGTAYATRPSQPPPPSPCSARQSSSTPRPARQPAGLVAGLFGVGDPAVLRDANGSGAAGRPSRPARASGRRLAIVGRVLAPSDPDYDLLIGTRVDDHRNPVTNTLAPRGTSTCSIGCGTAVPSQRAFAPGQDQRVIHDRIACQWGNTLGFID